MGLKKVYSFASVNENMQMLYNKICCIAEGDFLPSAHETYDLGSPTSAWNAVYLKDTTNGNTYRCEMVNGVWTQTSV